MVKFLKLTYANIDSGYPPLKIVRRPFGASGSWHWVGLFFVWPPGVAVSLLACVWRWSWVLVRSGNWKVWRGCVGFGYVATFTQKYYKILGNVT